VSPSSDSNDSSSSSSKVFNKLKAMTSKSSNSSSSSSRPNNKSVDDRLKKENITNIVKDGMICAIDILSSKPESRSDLIGSVVGIIIDKISPIESTPSEEFVLGLISSFVPYGQHASNIIKLSQMETHYFKERVEKTKNEFINKGIPEKKAYALAVFLEDYTGDTDISITKQN